MTEAVESGSSQSSAGKTSQLPVVLAAVAGLLTVAAVVYGPQALDKLRGPRVVVVDAVRIIEAASKVARDMQKPEDAISLGTEVAQKLNAELNLYSAQGVVVVVKQAVMAAPAAADITQDVATRIGVDISNVPGR